MPTQLSTDDFHQSLNGHVAAKGGEIHAKFGPNIGWRELQQILEDRACVRYPCSVTFDAALLQSGELAHPVPKSERPEDGFVIHVHPIFMTQLDQVPALVLYQLVVVNYGGFASADDAETFGATALGLGKDEYYDQLCALAELLDGCQCG